VRKSFAVISDESLAELLLLVLFVAPLVGDVESLGVACTAARRGASAEATVPAADVPDVVIELSCDKSIVPSLHLTLSNVHFTRLAQARTLNQFPPPAFTAGGDNPSSPTSR
jgi:hypothetical protein